MMESRAIDMQRSHITAIQTELASLQKVISQFLSFARPVEPEMDTIDLGALLQECIEEVRIAAPPDMEFTTIGEAPQIKADEAMLRQVFLNLIRNASESVDGSGRNGNIQIRCNRAEKENSVLVEVQDNGAGIRTEDLSRVFTPFFTTKRQGVGLGLAIAQKLVLQHNGSISVESSGQGTTFRVTLPIS